MTARALTLSFDNGPDPKVTPRVLDILRERGLRAHFYVLGKHIATPTGQALLAQMREHGHIVGNHSYTHETPLGNDPRPDAVAREIVATEALLGDAPTEKRFRPFGGGGVIGQHLLRPDVVDYLVDHRYSCVLWNSVPRDWEDSTGWAARALADIELRPHTVLVLHDIENACLDALPSFLDSITDRGIEVTLELPAECVPIVRGEVRSDLSPLVSEDSKGRS